MKSEKKEETSEVGNEICTLAGRQKHTHSGTHSVT